MIKQKQLLSLEQVAGVQCISLDAKTIRSLFGAARQAGEAQVIKIKNRWLATK